MQKDKISNIVLREIKRNKKILLRDDNGNADIHRRRVKRGRVLLKLLSTIGRSDFFEWLESAEPHGNFYEYGDYRIVKKNTVKRDLVNLSTVNQILEISKKCFEAGINPNGGTFSISKLQKMAESGFLPDDAKKFLPAFALLLGKMSNIIYNPECQIGDIYAGKDCSAPTNGISLISLYQDFAHCKDEEEAVDELASKASINVPENVFDNFFIDKRTHWSYRRVIFDQYRFEHEHDKQYIEFRSKTHILGNVIIDDKGIVSPQTFWSKNITFPGRPLDVPFPAPYPLWNLDKILEYGSDTGVIITDSLCGAYAAYQNIAAQIHEIENELENIKYKNLASYEGYQDSEFENELRAHVINKLNKQFQSFNNFSVRGQENHPQTNNQNEAEYNKARVIFRLNGYGLQFITKQTSAMEDQRDCLAYQSFLHVNINESNEWNRERIIQYIPHCDVANVEQAFKIFKEAYFFIRDYILKKRKDDEELRNQYQKNLLPRKQIIWSSWYGGGETALGVDWSALRERNVFYVIRKHDCENYKTAYKVYLGLRHIKVMRLTFVEDGTTKTPEEFVVQAMDEFSLDENSFTEENDLHLDEADVYDPDMNDDIQENPLLLAPLIREKSITLLYSEPGVGKTWLALSIANSLLYGCPTFIPGLGWEATEPKRVLLIDSEMSPNSVKKRLKILNGLYQQMWQQNEHKSGPFKLQYKLVSNEGWDLTNDNGEYRDRITRWLNLGKKNQIDFLILDNLSTLSGFNDSSKSWRQLFSWLQELAAKGCASLILHHSNKTTGDQRGSSIKSATVDNIIRVRKALPGRNSNIAISIHIDKGRDAYGKALDPFNVMLKIKDEKASWHTTMAKGTKSVSRTERNAMIFAATNSNAFNQQILADYFGIDLPTLKGIVSNESQANDTITARKIGKIVQAIQSVNIDLDEKQAEKLRRKIDKIISEEKDKTSGVEVDDDGFDI